MHRFLAVIRQTIGGAWRLWSRGVYIFFTRVLLVIVFLVGFYFNFSVFRKLSQDTTNITNLAFGIVATLAALCFSCARAIDNPEEDKDRFAYAGERFLHAAILMMTASIIKYAALEMGATQLEGMKLSDFVLSEHWRPAVASLILGSSVGILFFWALTSAHGGLIVVNRLLWNRLNRYPDWDNWW